jgi:serine protease Do
VNLDGYVIGINSAIASASGQSAGIGFAIPANLVQSILPDLITGGRVERGWLGVTMSDLDPIQAEANGLPAARGVLIREVQQDSPAASSGLERGDIILNFDGVRVDDMNHFRYLVAGARSGAEVEMNLYRRGHPMKVNVTLGDRDSGLAQIDPQGFERQQQRYTAPSEDTEAWFGMVVETATEDLAERYGVEYREGVIVTYVEPGSLADIEGINPGTILIEVDHQDVRLGSEFYSLKEKLDGRERAVALIGYDIRGNIRYYAIKPQS